MENQIQKVDLARGLKSQARTFYQAVNRYDLATLESMMCENYIQHNPLVPSGRAAFLAFVPQLERHGSEIENLLMLQEGNFVALHHRWHRAFPFGAAELWAWHVLRFDLLGHVAEHWSVMSASPPVMAWGRDDGDWDEGQIAQEIEEGELKLTLLEAKRRGKSWAFCELRRTGESGLMTREWLGQPIPTANPLNSNGMLRFDDSYALDPEPTRSDALHFPHPSL